MSNPNRKHQRYRCNQKLCVRYRNHGQQFIAYGRCNMVGKGGIGASMPAAQLEIGQEVALEITVSTPAAPVVLRARVTSRHGSTYGFQFAATDGQATATLQDLLRNEEVAAYLAPAPPPSPK